MRRRCRLGPCRFAVLRSTTSCRFVLRSTTFCRFVLRISRWLGSCWLVLRRCRFRSSRFTILRSLGGFVLCRLILAGFFAWIVMYRGLGIRVRIRIRIRFAFLPLFRFRALGLFSIVCLWLLRSFAIWIVWIIMLCGWMISHRGFAWDVVVRRR